MLVSQVKVLHRLADSYDLWLEPGTQSARGVILLTVSATGISVPDAQTRQLSQEDQPAGLEGQRIWLSSTEPAEFHASSHPNIRFGWQPLLAL
jgi:hypothetical protein